MHLCGVLRESGPILLRSEDSIRSTVYCKLSAQVLVEVCFSDISVVVVVDSKNGLRRPAIRGVQVIVSRAVSSGARNVPSSDGVVALPIIETPKLQAHYTVVVVVAHKEPTESALPHYIQQIWCIIIIIGW